MNDRTIVLRPRRENKLEQESTDDRPHPLLVSATDAAHALAIGRTTLYELVKSGDLTPIHIRRCVRFSMHEIERLVESLTRGRSHAAWSPATRTVPLAVEVRRRSTRVMAVPATRRARS